jgi:hypothetical protein
MKAKITANTNSTDVNTPILRALRAELLKKRQHLHAFGITKRKNKSVVYGSYRNAVDTGSLMRNIKIKQVGNSWEFHFDVIWATQVFGMRPELVAALEDVIVNAFGEALAVAVVLAEIDDWFD